MRAGRIPDDGVTRAGLGLGVLQTPTGTPTNGVELLDPWLPLWVQRPLASVVVLLVAYLVSKLMVRLLGRRIARHFQRPSLTRTALRGLRVGVFVVAILTVLQIYGLGLSDIALSVTVFSAVVGVVLAPIVGSVISGIFLLADQPYEIGDMIEIVDTNQTGFVEDITLRYTKVFTLDNTFVVIPNGSMRDRDVINYSAEDARTRLELPVLITYESDLEAARRLVETAARKSDVVIEGGPDIRVGAARYPAKPTCYVDEFGDHGISLALRYWVTEPYRLLAIRSEIQTRIWEAIADDDVDVEIAYPHSHLYFDETSGELDVALRQGDDGRTAGGDPQGLGGRGGNDHVSGSDERSVPTDDEAVRTDDGGDPGDAE